MTLEYYDQEDNFVGALDVEITAEDIVDYVIDMNLARKQANKQSFFYTLTKTRKEGIKYAKEFLYYDLFKLDELEEDESFIEFMKSKYADELED